VGSEKAATKLGFAVQPFDALVNASITPAVVVEVRTANDFRAMFATPSITVAIGNNPGGATLGGTLTRTRQLGRPLSTT
jgi:hypothetical protein